MASASPASARRTAASTLLAASWPARTTRPSSPVPRPHSPTPTRRLAGSVAMRSSGPIAVISAPRVPAASARSTTSGPMPRGSPRVTASRARGATALEADLDVGRATQRIDVPLDGELLAHLLAQPILDVLERHLALGAILRDLDDGELGPGRVGAGLKRLHETGTGDRGQGLGVFRAELRHRHVLVERAFLDVGMATRDRVERSAGEQRV